jgi:hypothetical protein
MAPGSRTTVRNLAADADLTLEDRSGTSSISPSQDPERAGVIDDLADHLPAARGAAPVP